MMVEEEEVFDGCQRGFRSFGCGCCDIVEGMEHGVVSNNRRPTGKIQGFFDNAFLEVVYLSFYYRL